jgi:microcystin degradation protein MlrC
VYSVVARGGAGGPVGRDTYEFYAGRIFDAVEEHGDDVDGVILPQHGAMVAEHLDDADGALVAGVRDRVGEELPIVVTIDPNANVSDRLVDVADAIVAYETTPHVDMGETGRTGMRLLLRTIRGTVDPVMHVERPPVIPSAVKSVSLEPPLADILARARELEEREDVLKVNVCQGFWLADVPHMGFSIVAVADGRPAVARDAARDVSRRVWQRRHDFREETLDAGAAVQRARELVDRGEADGPVVVAEMHDNPGGGYAADGTKVLRELLDRGVTNAGFAIMRDPEAVAACVRAGVGERLTLDLGGKRGDPAVFGEPLEDVDGYVKAITDGRFENTGPMETGGTNDLGRAVRLECGEDDGVTVVLAENSVQPWDAEAFRHVGVQPERLDVVGLKSAVHYRADYGRFASHLLSVDESPTETYERISRPMFPLDPVDDDEYPDWE